MKKQILLVLKKEIEALQKSLFVREHSYLICSQIGKKEYYVIEELDAFETLTSRFARTSDMLTQKFLRTLEEIDLDYTTTVRDRINLAEKKGIIKSSIELIQIRQLRNQIAHEYTEEEIYNIFEEVLITAPFLIAMVKQAMEHSKKY